MTATHFTVGGEKSVPITGTTAASPSRTRQSWWIRSTLAALVVAPLLAGPSETKAAWTQDKFVIGTALMETRSLADTAAIDRTLGTLAGAYVNLVRDGWFVTSLSPSQARKCLKTAADLGIRVFVPADPTAPLPGLNPANFGGVGSPEWNAISGFWINKGEQDWLIDPSFTLAQAQAWCSSLHAIDPSKATFMHSTQAASDLRDLFNSAAPGNLDMGATEDYLLPASRGTNTIFDDVRATRDIIGGHARWSYGFASHLESADPPVELEIRKMALWPPALGATGVIWWSWSYATFDDVIGWNENLATPTVHGYIPTAQLTTIARYNHYLRDIIGPAVMRSTYVGQYHDACDPGSPFIPCDGRAAELLPSETRELIYELGPHTFAGVWRSNDEPAGTYYVLVGNRSDSPISTHVTLKGTEFMRVGAAPSVMSFTGPSEYAETSVGTSERDHSYPDFRLSTFNVDLAGGEVCAFKVIRASAAAHFASLTVPAGNETYTPNQSVAVTWSTPLTNVRVRCYMDVAPVSGQTSAYFDLATAAGPISSTSVAMPLTPTAAGRIEVTGTDALGSAVTLTHQNPFKILPGAPPLTPEDVRATNGYSFQAMSSAPSGEPRLVSMANYYPVLQLSERSGGSWTTTSLVDDPGATIALGEGVAMVTTPNGDVHLSAIAEQDQVSPDDYPTHPSENSQRIRYLRRTGTSWLRETVAWVGNSQGNTAIAVAPDGTPWVAYNAGSWGQFGIALARRDASGWTNGPIEFPGTNARSISLKIAADGTPWFCEVSPKTGKLNLFEGDATYIDNGYTGQAVVSGVGSEAALELDGNGNPMLAYAKPGVSAGSSNLYFRTSTIDPVTLTVTLNAEQSVGTTEAAISGLSISRLGDDVFLGYVANGILYEAKLSASSTAPAVITELIPNQSATGPVCGIVNSAGRWYSYRDRTTNMLRAVHYAPDAGGGGGSDGGDDGGIMHSLKLASRNPVTAGGAVELQFRLSRPAKVQLVLVDVSGRVAASRQRTNFVAGDQHIRWAPGRIAPGVYFLRIIMNDTPVNNSRLVFLGS